MGRQSNFNVFVAILSILEITLKFQVDFKGIVFVSSLADIAGNRGLEGYVWFVQTSSGRRPDIH